MTGERDEFRVSSGGFEGLVRIEQKLEFPMTASDADQSRPIRWIVRSNTNLMQSDRESPIKGATAQ